MSSVTQGEAAVGFGTWWVRALTLILITHGVTGQTGAPNCQTPVNSCSCKTDQGLLDLSPLDNCAGDPSGNCATPKFFDVVSSDGSGDVFSFNPCTGFTELAGCSNVGACQNRAQITYPLGDQKTAAFTTDPTKGLTLTMTSTDPQGTVRTSLIQLVCDKTVADGNLEVQGEDPSTADQYLMTLTSTHCCPQGGKPTTKPPPHTTPGTAPPSGGLSGGSVLLIIFFSLTAVYFIGGILFNKFARQKEGTEIVPNVTFWKDLPILVKDGAVFVVTKIKGRTTAYQEI